MSEVILWMNDSPLEHIAANRVMLCTINEFMLTNMRGVFSYEYNEIIAASGSAGIIR